MPSPADLSWDVPFRVPAEFVLERGHPTSAELAHGHQQGWLSARDTIRIVDDKARRGCVLTSNEKEMVLLWPGEDDDQLPGLVEGMAVSGETRESRQRYWSYISLGWLWRNRESVEDPFLVLENIFSFLDYPDEMRGFVRFLPVSDGDEPGEEAMKVRWSRYLSALDAVYRDRDLCSEAVGRDPSL